MHLLKTCTNAVLHGLCDSFRWINLLRDRKVQNEIGRCCAINGIVFLLYTVLFKYGFLLGFNFTLKLLFGTDVVVNFFSSLEPYIFKIFVIIPLFSLTKFIWICHGTNVDVYKCRHLQLDRPQDSDLLAWSVEYVMDPFISIAMQCCFLLQIITFTYMLMHIFAYTLLAHFLIFLHMCLLYSLFAFEFVWFSKGWEANRRLENIENNWLYFAGFGLPLAILTEFSESWFTSGLSFAVALPIFIISASEADSASKACNIFPLRFFFPTRIMAIVPLYIMTKESVLFKYPVKERERKKKEMGL